MSDSCNNCKYCNFCNSCNFCNYCNYCKYCNFCDSCDSCNSCDTCNSCDFCNYCNYCNYCKNLVNGYMCIKLKLVKQDKNKYWLFNKEVTQEEFDNRYKLGFEEKVCDKCGHKID